MKFEDYAETKSVYHVVSIIDLKGTMENGISYNAKSTYKSKYLDFHKYFDSARPDDIPSWVERKRAIFASMNFKQDHSWHSHTAVLKVKINEDKCWICNENIANFLYEPLILQDYEEIKSAAGFVKRNGAKVVEEYWRNSLSFKENLVKRMDKKPGYDAEVLILHDILPQDIECLYIISDHKVMSLEEWKSFFERDELSYV